MPVVNDPFQARSLLKTGAGQVSIFRLEALEKAGLGEMQRLPYSLRILLETALRQLNGKEVTEQDVLNLAGWKASAENRPSFPFFPGRVLLQDFSGVPVLVDLAAMRAALHRVGGDPLKVNPVIPVDLVIDHSLQVDFAASPDAMRRNIEMEFKRNRERYEFLRWGQKAFCNLQIIPPATGIVHQVNLEYLTRLVLTSQEGEIPLAYPDTVIGTDSHTTMVNGLGVVGWGVGGIEAVSAMVGEPVEMPVPDVTGFRLAGRLADFVTPTDLTLTIVQMLRKRGVVNRFVEFFGPGVEALTTADRAMIANMSPENGATVSYFPVDEQTLEYLRLTGRPPALVDLVERYYKEQGLFHTSDSPRPDYSDVLELDLGAVEASVAGPKRPHDRIPLGMVKSSFRQALAVPRSGQGFEVPPAEMEARAEVIRNGASVPLTHGSVVLAAITSCTNTSNPFVMAAAGLLAKKAVEKGLRVSPAVRTSFAPGSRVVTAYLQKAGLMEPLEQLGFHLVGYGCAVCIGNSGPLDADIAAALDASGLVAAAVLSGNRNFEGRVSPHTQANYLASPPLVVAYALAGTVNIDLAHEPLGKDPQGHPVFLSEIWPSNAEVQAVVAGMVTPELFIENYRDVLQGSQEWNRIESGSQALYPWNPDSTYIQEPPFFNDLDSGMDDFEPLTGMRALAFFGDSVTTDHISPAGDIPAASAAGGYLLGLGVPRAEFNSYGARRGNDRVLVRGTFANIRLKNRLVPEGEGSRTLHLPDGGVGSIFETARRYQQEGVPLVILAGKEYGSGSSRDWAAKGPRLLGVRAVLAQSFERIHRSNLVGMGILPLQFLPGESAESLGLTGLEGFSLADPANRLERMPTLSVKATAPDGTETRFKVKALLMTDIEVEYYRSGGILQTVLKRLKGKI